MKNYVTIKMDGNTETGRILSGIITAALREAGIKVTSWYDVDTAKELRESQADARREKSQVLVVHGKVVK